jgi:tRNA dimethylallyltransferase
MPSPKDRLPLVVLLGPTAVGKTELSLQLAEWLGMEIVSADSRLLYRGMDIGTAKPTPRELARVPHHLVDVADPDETWSLARYQQAAHAAIVSINFSGKTPLLVGGAGQYLRAILQGWTPPRLKPNPELRAALEAWAAADGAETVHHHLTALDPPAAANIDYRNLRRSIRALEVVLSTGDAFSAQRSSQESPYTVLQIGLMRPRPELYARIDARIQAMLDAGLLEEIRGLLAAGYSPDLPSLSAIGYRELIQHLHGELSLEEAVTLIKRHTRAFVRRQANWFKPDDADIHWFEMGEGDVGEKIKLKVEEFLNSLQG